VFYTNTITPDIGVDILEVKHIVMMMLQTTNRRKKFIEKKIKMSCDLFTKKDEIRPEGLKYTY